MRRLLTFVALVVLLASLACETGRRSPAGFRLPENGSIERGEMAFLDLACNNCHGVVGADIPGPPPDAEFNLPLGGEHYEVRTDGYLVTSIIHPSHRLGRFGNAEISEKGESRMPDFTRKMTMRDLVDIVAFLQAHYKLKPLPRMYP